MYDHTFFIVFVVIFLQAFSTEEILKPHIKDCFEINVKQER